MSKLEVKINYDTEANPLENGAEFQKAICVFLGGMYEYFEKDAEPNQSNIKALSEAKVFLKKMANILFLNKFASWHSVIGYAISTCDADVMQELDELLNNFMKKHAEKESIEED